MVQPKRRLRRLVDLESLHRDRAGRTPFGAQATADAARLVLDDGTQIRAAADRIPNGVDLVRGAQPSEWDERQARLRADLDAAAAEDAALGIKDRLNVAPQAARRFQPCLLFTIALFDLSEPGPACDRQPRHGLPWDPVVWVPAAVQVDRPEPRPSARHRRPAERFMNRERRALPVGLRLDDNSRSEGEITAAEHAGHRGLERPRIDRHEAKRRDLNVGIG